MSSRTLAAALTACLLLGFADLALLSFYLVPAAFPPREARHREDVEPPPAPSGGVGEDVRSLARRRENVEPSQPSAKKEPSSARERAAAIPRPPSAPGAPDALDVARLDAGSGREPGAQQAVSPALELAEGAGSGREPGAQQPAPGALELAEGAGSGREPGAQQAVSPALELAEGAGSGREPGAQQAAPEEGAAGSRPGSPPGAVTTAAALEAPGTKAAREAKRAEPAGEGGASTGPGPTIDLPREEVVLFDTSRDTLNRKAIRILEDVANILLEDPALSVRVEGHTDRRGDEAFNRYLSQTRARAVAAFLEAKGVAPGRIETQAFGSTRPADSRNNPSAWARNRRVNLHVFKGEP